MALIKCLECEKEISSEANRCPHCGAARSKSIGLTEFQKAGMIILGLGLLIAGFLLQPFVAAIGIGLIFYALAAKTRT